MNKLDISKNILIIGAELESIILALKLAETGHNITLITENDYLGGRLYQNRLSAAAYNLDEKIKMAEDNKNIRILIKTKVMNASGAVGNFRVFLANSEITVISVSMIIISEGTEFIPAFNYLSDNFISLSQLNCFFNPNGIIRSEMLKIANKTFKNIGFFITPDSTSRYYINEVFEYALFFKKRYGANVSLILPQVLVAGDELENTYRTLRDGGVLVLKYQESPGIDYLDKDAVTVSFRDGAEIDTDFDLFIYSEKPVNSVYFNSLSKILRVNRYNNINFQIFDTPRKGVYTCGLSREDLINKECVQDAATLADEINSITESGSLEYEDGIIKVDKLKCTLCLTCVRACPHGAIEMDRDILEERVIKIYDEACFHCGTCTGECPTKAMSFIEEPVLNKELT